MGLSAHAVCMLFLAQTFTTTMSAHPMIMVGSAYAVLHALPHALILQISADLYGPFNPLIWPINILPTLLL